ncbi:MAG TPA: hypothetical protein PLO90_05180 [Clostridia bacterium]|jgi:hypothetical protein|nr:hypothetical protein [Clostridia bacterium]HPY43740.1 hypothetical protein [Clostridia bacterium]HQA97151.1 hypothetical protein [Clostridia bacterium]HUM61834.1 hypothetical protein [Clostridia bacterium]
MMKKLAVFSVLLMALVVGVTLWGYANARLSLTAQAVRALPPEEHGTRFASLKRQLDSGAVRGTVYDKALRGGEDDYVILEYTISVANRGLVEARMLEAVVVPLAGDVLCFSQQEYDRQEVNSSIDVQPGRQVMLRCYLLTRRDAHAVREIQVSYYVWGNPFIVKVRYG